jgi:SAM-dependent methyltransferase
MDAVNQGEVESFANQVLNDTRGWAVTIMAALGDVLGLFKNLAHDGPATSSELSARTGTNERYVREWLGGMLSAGYLTFDRSSGRFSLPAEHIPALAKEPGLYYFGGTHQMILGLVGVIPFVQRAFKEGGGVPMSAYDANTWEGMERDMAGPYELRLVQEWIPAMPHVRAMLERGVGVADLGCGGGRVLVKLAQAFPDSRFTGYDLVEANVQRAAARAEQAGVAGRVRFQALDGSADLPQQFDIITTFDVVHDAANPPALLRSIRRSLRAGGRYVCFDAKSSERLEENVDAMSTLRYGWSLLYCMTTSLAYGGMGLGPLGLPESKMRELCLDAGFSEVRVASISDPFHSLYEVSP